MLAMNVPASDHWGELAYLRPVIGIGSNSYLLARSAAPLIPPLFFDFGVEIQGGKSTLPIVALVAALILCVILISTLSISLLVGLVFDV